MRPSIKGAVRSQRLMIEELAEQQGVTVVPFDELLGDFWPEDESADDFIAFVREHRQVPNREIDPD